MSSAEPQDVTALVLRVAAEFREMPGLRLTLPQAARLFGLDQAQCQRVLDRLIADGMLASNGQTFARTDEGGPRRLKVPLPVSNRL